MDMDIPDFTEDTDMASMVDFIPDLDMDMASTDKYADFKMF